jgi:hypothetical protein
LGLPHRLGRQDIQEAEFFRLSAHPGLAPFQAHLLVAGEHDLVIFRAGGNQMMGDPGQLMRRDRFRRAQFALDPAVERPEASALAAA